MTASTPRFGDPGLSTGRRSQVLFGAAGLVLFLALWQAIVIVGGYPPFILPPPDAVIGRLVSGWTDGTIAPHALRTLVEVALGFGVGGGAALVVGYALARSAIVERLVSPYIVAAQATPILALSPILALWFGPGLLSKVVICALIVFFPIAIATMVGIRSVDAGLLELGRSLRATRRQILTTLEIPAALPSIFGGLRVGVTLLGVLINLARGSLFDIPLLFATLVTIALLGVALYVAVVLVERTLLRAR